MGHPARLLNDSIGITVRPGIHRGRSPVNESTNENEPQPRGALLLILIYLAILAAFWINTYLRIWRS
jgi:hypothetical protein